MPASASAKTASLRFMMSKRTLSLLLAISLAFNLAFLGSIIYLHLRAPRRRPIPFTPVKRVELPSHIGDVRDNPEIRQMRSQFDRIRVNLMEELAKETVDETRVLTIIDSSLAAQEELEQSLGQNLLEIRKQMSSEEAEEYFQAQARRMELRSQHINRRDLRRHNREKDYNNRPDARARTRHPDRQNPRRSRDDAKADEPSGSDAALP